MNKIDELLETTFKVQPYEGEDKRTTLPEAVRNHVKPGMLLYFSGDARAPVREVIRQFWGTKPNFSVVAGIFGDQSLLLVHLGMVKKLMTAVASHLAPTPGPSAVIQKAFKERTCQIESWSLFSITQRFMAAALGVPFMPTRAIVGTSMEQENKDAFVALDDPFKTGKRIGLVKALHPDMVFLHVWAADPNGNAIPSLSDAEGIWAARASNRPIVITTEKIVSTEFLRDHAHQVKIPGYMVDAVVELPFGAHPRGMNNQGLEEFEGYGDDREFGLEYRKASQEDESTNRWIKEWVLECPTHNDYLQKIGMDRLTYLKGKTSADFWQLEFDSLKPKVDLDAPYNSVEFMVCGAARKMMEIMLKNHYKTILFGVGTGSLACWMTQLQLKKQDHHTEVVIGTGQYGVAARPGTGAFGSRTAKMSGDITDLYGVVVGGAKSSCLGVLGSGQIDKYGNINSNKMSEDVFLGGIGGGGDGGIGANEIIVIGTQSRRRFQEKVYYVSIPGDRIKTIVSNMGVYEKLGADPEFVLMAYFPDPKFPSKDAMVREIKANCGWDLKVSPQIRAVEPPTKDELALLRMLDMRKSFIGGGE